MGFSASGLVMAKPGEASRGAQFPKLGLLHPSDVKRFAIQIFGGLRMPLPQEQLAFVPVQLRHKQTFPCPFNDLQSFVDQAQGPSNLPCDRICPTEEREMIRCPHRRCSAGTG